MKKNLLLWICLFLATTAQAEIITVDDDGPADFNNIQAAINNANDHDTVVVFPGTYTGNGNRDIDFLGKPITVRSTDPNDPNIVAATTVDCNGAWLDGHRGFHFHTGEDPNSVLDGLTIRNGYGWDEFDGGDVVEHGGGILIENSRPTIRNCFIINNLAEFSGAHGVHGGFGGGICCYNNGNAVITNCTIISNTADRGAGIACWESNPTISNCIVSAGSASSGGGGIDCGNNSNPLIINCTIAHNYTTAYGGGIWCSNSNPSILNCTIKGNSAGDGAYGNGLGGGIACTDSSPTIRDCVIVGNYASVSGGGLCCDAHINPGNPSIINCTITHNHTDGEGGGMYCYLSDPIIGNSILWGNTADSSGPQVALFLNPSWPSTLTVSYCDMEGGQADAYVADGCSLIWLTGNIDADPCFLKPGYWAFDYNIPEYLNNRFWIDGDYHLLSTSPCINAGDPNFIAEPNETDLDGKPRVIGGRIDMGAYEFNHVPVADAGPNQIVYAWIDGIAEVTLDGNDSYDADGDELTYLWTWTVDGNTYEANSVSPTIELPVGEHTIGLIVNDGIEYSEPDYVDVNVVAPLEADLRMMPRVINRCSRMRRIMAFVRLPEGITKDQIDRTEPLMLYPASSDEGIRAIRQYILRPRRYGTEHTCIFAFFNKAQLMDAVSYNGRVELQVVGSLKSGQYFYGSDNIWIIKGQHRWWARWRRW